MTDLRTRLIMDLTGNLPGQARQFARSVEQIGERGRASIGLMRRTAQLAGSGLDRLGNRYTALIAGGGGMAMLRQVGNMEERMVRLGISADASGDQIEALKKRVFETAVSPDIRVDPGQLLSAIEDIVEKTGDLDFARENIRNIGLAIQATSAQGADIGGIMAEFQKMDMGSKEAFEALEILTVQGKAGAFTLQKLAALGPRVVTAYTAMGRTGVPAMREMGAALQMIQRGTGTPEMAATAFEAVLRTLGDAKKVQALQKRGIRVFEPGSTTQMRSIVDLMEEIVIKSGGSKLKLNQIFDAEAIRAFNSALGEFQKTGRVDSLRRFYDVQATGAAITGDAGAAADTFNQSLNALGIVWQKFADQELAGPIQKLADALGSLEPGTVERWLGIGKNIAMIGGGAVVASKVVRGVSGALSLARGLRGGAGGVAGALGAAAGGPVPVYVTNMGGMPDVGVPGGSTPGKAGGATTAKNVATGGALAAGGAAVAGAAMIGGAMAFYKHEQGRVDQRVGGMEVEQLAATMNRYAQMNETTMREYRQAKARLEEAQMRGELKITIDQRGFVKVDKMQTTNLELDVSGRTMEAWQ